MTETLGKYLVACRQKKGLAVEEVAQITRINPRLICAAETDRFEELPGRVFIRGFLRSYAEVVGVDGAELIKRFESLGMVDVDRSPQLISMPLHNDSTGTSVMMLYAAIITALVIIVAVYLFGPQIDADPPLSVHKGDAALQPAQTAQKTPAAPMEAETAPAKDDDTTAVKEAGGDPAQEAIQAAVTKEEQEETTETRASVEPDTAIPADLPYSLNIMAESDSWIRVVIDGEAEREIILRAGNSVTWKAKKGYLISIGNVAGTRMFLNGEEIKLRQPTSNVLTMIRLPDPDSQ
ncbi:MAG TPA: helix-turn-helix domain-containing protein [Nitrospirae bacterium]|nr:helix-turn-helix domain-containing protein [Nitrospirota bacterium]